MSTSYFILSKSPNKEICNNDDNGVVLLQNKINYILPRNLLTFYSENGLFESGLIEWCKQFCRKDKTMLDIGAHTGSYALSLAPYCKSVYAFEPQKMTYYALCGGVALSNINNIECLNIGLGSKEQVGSMTLNIVSNDGGGSSIHNNTDVLAREEIQIDMLDNWNISNISFIKLDVEDNEQYVLEGAKQTIIESEYPPIMFECNDRAKHQGLFDVIQELTYSVITINGLQNMYLACRD